ncbi:MAG: UDP-2,3-diacylglucosamine diphosphatase [Betaproteobacteria bacterium]|nr:UDP-2,3-diacylglucosamine diphosphatase [Betaproteobacteria bacterium]
MATLFISDLHLGADRPHINEQFFGFVQRAAAEADALYVLGDLFEYWVGDDDLADPFNASIGDALKALGEHGVPIHLMHGNRDVLLGREFARHCGAALVADPLLLDLYGTPTLLMHGDTLCTDDIEYQKFRVYARDPDNQAQFLAQPLARRKQQMAGLRADSESAKQGKTGNIMDVALATVEQTLRDFHYPRLIHGHTHRPARHVHVVDGHQCERWVLNDWYQRGGYLRCDAGGCTAVRL